MMQGKESVDKYLDYRIYSHKNRQFLAEFWRWRFGGWLSRGSCHTSILQQSRVSTARTMYSDWNISRSAACFQFAMLYDAGNGICG